MPLIYIFDNDPDIMLVLCTWFKSHGYKAKGFTISEELFSCLEKETPECIIIDGLYGMSPFTTDICQKLQNVFNYKGKIVLSTTGRVSKYQKQQCNAVDILSKPFDLQDILNRVNNMLVLN